ncbi:hypothetical protein Tco_0787471 [Tanacetum coccineum]
MRGEKRVLDLSPSISSTSSWPFNQSNPIGSHGIAKVQTDMCILHLSIPIIPCLMADSLAVRTLYSARAIVVKRALVAQRASIVVTSHFLLLLAFSTSLSFCYLV